MKKRMPALECACVGGLLAVFLNCGGDSVSGGTTETGNAVASGVIYNPDGSPAAGAVVRFISVSHNPHPQGLSKRLAVLDSTITNSQGEYSLGSLPADTINVLASGDSGLWFQDSIIIEPDTLNTIPPGQLKKAGSVRGAIRLGDSDDSRTVIILVFGTNTWAAPDDSIGNFSLANMADGTYHVRFLTTTPDYSPLDMELQIRAGVDSVLADTIRLPFKGMPVVTGLRLSYDTLKQLVTLTWNTPTTGRAVKGYNVYRKHADSTSFVKIAGVIADTVFVDSTAAQDQTYEYRVAAVDNNASEGTKSTGIQHTNIGALTIIDSIDLPFGVEPGQIQGIADGDVDSNGNIYVIDRINGRNKRFQKFDSSGRCQFTVDSFYYPVALAIGPQNISYVADRSNNEIVKFDSAGAVTNRWRVSEPLRFLLFQESRLFASTDVGVNIYDENDSLLNRITSSFNWNSGGGDIAADSINKIYITDAQTLFLLNIPDKTIATITKFPYGYQNPHIKIFSSTKILLSMQNTAGPTQSVVFLIDRNSGGVVMKWTTNENISDIALGNSNKIFVFTFSNRILKIQESSSTL